MMERSQQHIQFAQRAYQAMADADMAWMTEHCHPDVLFVQGGRFPTAGTYQGRDAMFGHYGEFMAMIGGQFQLSPIEFLGGDERVAVYLTVTIGTGDDRLEFDELHLWRIVDDRLVEMHAVPLDPYAVDAYFEQRTPAPA